MLLETPRLRLRMLADADFDAFAEMCADPEVMRYVGDHQPMGRSFAWRRLALFVGHWSLRGYGLWAVADRSTDELLGYAGFWNPEGWPDFELGWSLRRRFWGRGFATEAAQAALRHAFTVMNRPHVISLIHPDNAASIRVAQRLGERQAGTVDLFGTTVLMYRITRAEWEERKP